MSALKDLRLYATHPHPCSYLEGRYAKTLFIDPDLLITREQHSRLSEIGFRRSGSHLYRPFCDDCQACIPCRVLVDEFSPSRRFRRILKRNSDIEVSTFSRLEGEEYYLLYRQYINARHQDGDMYPASHEQYLGFLGAACDSTVYYVLRDRQRKLLGVVVCDHLDHGLSAVYTFFDPEEEKRSLGSFAILWQIQEAQRLGLPYLYLGYWIKACRKMEYKDQYRPLQLYIKGAWQRLDADASVER